MGRIVTLLFAASIAACGLSMAGTGPDGHDVSTSSTDPAPPADASAAVDHDASSAAPKADAAASDASQVDACTHGCDDQGEDQGGKRKGK